MGHTAGFSQKLSTMLRVTWTTDDVTMTEKSPRIMIPGSGVLKANHS